MRVKTFFRVLRLISAVALFFFVWTYLPAWQIAAYAAEKKQNSGARVQGPGIQNQGPGARVQGPGERFEKALEGIRDHVNRAEEKSHKGEEPRAEIETIKTKKAELETIDAELKTEFAATEKKLKEAHLPGEILERHHKFVKHYQDNLKELIGNLEQVEKAQTRAEVDRTVKKAKLHLEKTKPPRKHKPLDPNKLPHRMVKAKEKAPRLKKEEFEKDFGPQKKRPGMRNADFGLRNLGKTTTNHKPIMLAFNGPVSDMPLNLPLPSGERAGVRGGYDTTPFAISDFNSQSAIRDPQFMVAQATVTPPSAEDLAETPEVQFTPELRKIATLLESNPVQFYEFVRNNFAYDPYYGSVKGSQGTLLLQQGNDFDQASVLIALFRVSNIPARYVYGTVEIPIEKVMKWLGGVTDPRTAGNLLVTNGIPAKLILSGGVIKSVQLEHVWTEVYIPYANYRGKINDPTAAKTWIPLDPSFKLIEPNPDALDLADAQQFNIDSYLSSYLQTVKPKTPAKEYLKNTMDYVSANIPGKRFYDLLVSNNIIDKALDLLPDTLSYPVKTIGAKFSAIPDNYRHDITLEITNSSNETILSYNTSWPTVLHNRFTLSYDPATVADEQIIANYGDIYSAPSYLIKVKPVLKVEGVSVSEGSAVPMASDLTFRMNFVWPDGTIDKAVTNILVAGAMYAIGLGSGYTTGRIVTNRTAKLEAAVNAGQIGEPIIGEYLNLFAVNYLQELDSSRKLIAKSMKTLDTNRTAELMVGVDLGVSAIFGMPRAVDIRGLLIDVDYNIATPVNMDGDQTKIRRFQILTGMTSSAMEHTMFESIIGVEAVSTIKALEVANVQGIPVQQIDASNIAAKLPILQVSGEVKADIQNAVNAGKVVTVSERNIQLNNWNGVGYIVLDTTTGAGAYQISGGMSGGSLTQEVGGLRDLVAQGKWTEAKAKEWIRDHKNYIWFPSPVIGSIKSPFGMRNGKPHNGVDFYAEIFTPVAAVGDGTVTRSDYSSPDNIDKSFGYVVEIDHGLGVKTRYAHNATLLVTVGEQVKEGKIISYSGNTGHVDPMPTLENPTGGQHLHFEILFDGTPVNPADFDLGGVFR